MNTTSLLPSQKCRVCKTSKNHSEFVRPCACTTRIHSFCLEKQRGSGKSSEIFWACPDCHVRYTFSVTPYDPNTVQSDYSWIWISHISTVLFIACILFLLGSGLLWALDGKHLLFHFMFGNANLPYWVGNCIVTILFLSCIGFFFILYWFVTIPFDPEEFPCCAAMGPPKWMIFISCIVSGGLGLFYLMWVTCHQKIKMQKQKIKDRLILKYYKVVETS
jgi:hypothetical protein